MDELREALRDGLREEAAPISRRLAEVKGLSNNAVRRLERIESTIDAERLARVDDLALLVELLTEGWRSMNARLDRIEAALAINPATIVRLRESA
jgi:transcriptional regulator with XRE-family HTH domain